MDAENRREGIFEKYEGDAVVFSVPSEMEGITVSEIAPKAFLSCKTIQKLEIPNTVHVIGDWAFAHMKNLEELVIPFRSINCGKKAFLDCKCLKRIVIRGSTARLPGLPYFLASAICVLGKDALWKPEQVGDAEQCEIWLQAYDKALEEYLEATDEEGFEPVFIGWFHVEDMDEQIPRYVMEKQRKKIRLILQRLHYQEGLTEQFKEKLYAYLKAHMSVGTEKDGCASVLDMVCDRKEEYCNQVGYIKILRESGCLNRENIEYLLKGLDGVTPEVIAFLLVILEEERQTADFFTGLEL